MDLRERPAHTFARHPWEMARADFFLHLLRGRLLAGSHALDVGAGDGYFARRLATEVPEVASTTGFDPGYDRAWLSTLPSGSDHIAFTAELPAKSFDLVVLLDVIEHTDDDRALLDQAIACAARPGGWLLLSAPAHPMLFSHHDELLGHRRRYAPRALRELTAGAGLELVCAGQLFTTLLVPRVLAKLGERLRCRAPAPAGPQVETALGRWHHGTMVTSAVRGLLVLDGAASRWAARRKLPLPGLSTWVLARRP